MKRLLSILLAVSPILSAIAQPSNLVVNVLLPRQNFYAGGASYSDTTNVQALTNIDGYFYPSNFVVNGGQITRWQFNPSIIRGTNYVVGIQVLTTNITFNSGFAATYRVSIYTNNGNLPYYTSDVFPPSIWANLIGGNPANNTNVAIWKVTNNLPANALLQRSNFTYGTVAYRIFHGGGSANVGSEWLVGGYIEFR